MKDAPAVEGRGIRDQISIREASQKEISHVSMY